MSNNEIMITNLIVHVLDSSVGMPVLSDVEHLLDSDIEFFLEKHILKLFDDISFKKVYFKDEQNQFKEYCELLKSNEKEFINISRNISSKIYKTLSENPEIPSADAIFVVFNYKNTKYLGILKLNYKASYIHFVEEGPDGINNKIIKQRTSLPSETQKIDEAILINLEDFSILLKEKKYDIEGEKKFYLSTTLLNTTEVLSDKEKIGIIDKTSKKVIKKYYDGDITKTAEIKNAIVKSVEETNTIDIQKIANKVFSEQPEVKKAYIEEVQKNGIHDESISVSPKVEKIVSKKHKIVADDDIEIKIPAAYLTRKDKVEFLTNPDGSISIILKNISSLNGA